MKRLSYVVMFLVLASMTHAQPAGEYPPPPPPPSMDETDDGGQDTAEEDTINYDMAVDDVEGVDDDMDDEVEGVDEAQTTRQVQPTQASAQIPTEQDCALYIQDAKAQCDRAIASQPEGVTLGPFMLITLLLLFALSGSLNVYLALQSRVKSSSRADQLAAHYYNYWRQQMMPIMRQQGIAWNDFQNAVKKLLK